jgi:hypothetical protein
VWWWVLVAPWTPRLIWVRDLTVGGEMVDWSVRRERLRPLSLWWVIEPGRVSRRLRMEDDLSSGEENLPRCHDRGSIRMS